MKIKKRSQNGFEFISNNSNKFYLNEIKKKSKKQEKKNGKHIFSSDPINLHRR